MNGNNPEFSQTLNTIESIKRINGSINVNEFISLSESKKVPLKLNKDVIICISMVEHILNFYFAPFAKSSKFIHINIKKITDFLLRCGIDFKFDSDSIKFNLSSDCGIIPIQFLKLLTILCDIGCFDECLVHLSLINTNFKNNNIPYRLVHEFNGTKKITVYQIISS